MSKIKTERKVRNKRMDEWTKKERQHFLNNENMARFIPAVNLRDLYPPTVICSRRSESSLPPSSTVCRLWSPPPPSPLLSPSPPPSAQPPHVTQIILSPHPHPFTTSPSTSAQAPVRAARRSAYSSVPSISVNLSLTLALALCQKLVQCIMALVSSTSSTSAMSATSLWPYCGCNALLSSHPLANFIISQVYLKIVMPVKKKMLIRCGMSHRGK